MSAQQQPQDQQRSLYRRHRPRTFDEVVGQDPVVRTLRNAVQREKVHHAYLFVGSRGTGKTSMAKILAACLNCERGPTIEPCGQCESCVSIARATSLDVIEADAASNNSVDDIRELRESVAYAPVSGRRKVYILDEAHMLSTAAWNAFLKTLEEPPPNTVFVLATTEASKVPATVVDRCHRFDFHRPTVEQIASVVARTAEAESIEIPPPAVAAIARSATGSFRDALGTLEQLVTYSGSQIALADVLAVLGIADARLLEETVDAVAGGDAARALTTLEQCLQQGRDAGSFSSDLEARARELMVVQTLEHVPDELSLTPEADAALLAQAQRVDRAAIVRLLELLGEAMDAVRAGADARTRLELALVKAARPDVDGSMRALLARIERLEAERPVVSAVASQHEPPAAARHAPSDEARDAPPAPPAPAGDPHEATGDGPEATGDGHGATGDGPEATGDPHEATGDGPEATGDAHEPAGDPRTAPLGRVDATGDATEAPAGQAAAHRAEAAPAARSSEPTVASAPHAVAVDAAPRDLASLLSLWPAVVDLVRGENAMLGACIADARPVDVEDDVLVLALSSPFMKKKAEAPANRASVGEALTSLSGARWRVSYELREDLDAGHGAEPDERSEEEWVARFMQEFDAEEITQAREQATRDQARTDGGGDDDAEAVTSNERGA